MLTQRPRPLPPCGSPSFRGSWSSLGFLHPCGTLRTELWRTVDMFLCVRAISSLYHFCPEAKSQSQGPIWPHGRRKNKYFRFNDKNNNLKIITTTMTVVPNGFWDFPFAKHCVKNFLILLLPSQKSSQQLNYLPWSIHLYGLKPETRAPTTE